MKILVIGAIILSTIPFLMVGARTELLTDPLYKLANVLGYIGMLFMIWNFILGNRAVMKFISKDIVWLLKIHKNLGIYGALLVFAHPILEMIVYMENITFLFLPNLSTEFDKHMTLGRAAFVLLIFVWVSSSILRKKLKFRPWLFIHYLTYPLTLFAFLHAFTIGTFIENYPVIRTYWLILGAIFFAITIIRIMQAFNLDSEKYSIKHVKKLNNDVWIYTLTPLGEKQIPQVGQFYYIKLSKFGESHPFTIMGFDDETGELIFGIKTLGKFTQRMEKLGKGDKIYVEGPYGVFTKEGHNNNPKVIIAGGIGITPFIELVKRYGNKQTYMINCNRYLKNAVETEDVRHLLSDRYFDAISREKSDLKNVYSCRIDKNVITSSVPKEIIGHANYFICGQVKFIHSVRKLLRSVGVKKNQIFFEEF